jgi:hypothetical protein
MAKPQIQLTASVLKECLSYNQETGEFFWLSRPEHHFRQLRDQIAWNCRNAGHLAGAIDSKGYWRIALWKRHYRAHRLAFLYVKGRLPDGDVDHVDGDRLNNRFSNLREATRVQNLWNTQAHKDSRTGVKGVHWHDRANKYQARIYLNGKTVSLGLFSTVEAASAAYQKASREAHGDFSHYAA